MQHGQVFELTTRGPDGQRLWAYRYRLEGRGSRRPQRRGFASRQDAEAALDAAVSRARRRASRSSMTLAALVTEYLLQHDAQPETTAKLRWLLGKSPRYRCRTT